MNTGSTLVTDQQLLGFEVTSIKFERAGCGQSGGSGGETVWCERVCELFLCVLWDDQQKLRLSYNNVELLRTYVFSYEF